MLFQRKLELQVVDKIQQRWQSMLLEGQHSFFHAIHSTLRLKRLIRCVFAISRSNFDDSSNMLLAYSVHV